MNGLIGFFDILGYQNFLNNNSAIDSALEVLDIITGIPVEVKAFMTSQADTEDEKEVSDALKHLVFSDTIVLTLAYPDEADEAWKSNAHTFMSISSVILAAEMFKKGLPIRGVIHEGDFITKETCLAGKGIVEAYKLCESLDFSGVIFSEKLVTKRNLKHDNNGIYLFTYLTPRSDGSESKLLNGNWINFLGENHVSQCRKDVEKFVLESFWAHQKDCSINVDSKVRNTVKIIRKMLHNIDIDKAKKTDMPLMLS